MLSTDLLQKLSFWSALVCSRRTSDRPPRRRPLLEALEDRLAPAVFNPLPGAADGAGGSLRAAVVEAKRQWPGRRPSTSRPASTG